MNSVKINDDGDLITNTDGLEQAWSKEIYTDEYIIYKGEKWFLIDPDDE